MWSPWSLPWVTERCQHVHNRLSWHQLPKPPSSFQSKHRRDRALAPLCIWDLALHLPGFGFPELSQALGCVALSDK